MFRLIKLGMYALIGYVLYELYQGMTQQQGGRASQGGGGVQSRSMGEGSDANDAGIPAALTGPGGGTTEVARDVTGGEMRHTVGRGVVR